MHAIRNKNIFFSTLSRVTQDSKQKIKLIIGFLVFLSVAAIGLLSGCHGNSNCTTVIISLDTTKSTVNLRDQYQEILDQLVGKELDPDCTVIGRNFCSTVSSSPFFQSTASDVDGFHEAVKSILEQIDTGSGTFGGPVLKRIREDAAGKLFSIAVIVSDGGFDDLLAIAKEARLLAQIPGFKRLFILPVTDRGDFAQQLQDALKPLGNRVRIATRHDVQQALKEVSELQEELARSSKGGHQ